MKNSKHYWEDGTDTHHFYWPKRFYKNNHVIELPYRIHHSYHGYFMHKCMGRKRQCKFCQYNTICCYAFTTKKWGEAL